MILNIVLAGALAVMTYLYFIVRRHNREMHLATTREIVELGFALDSANDRIEIWRASYAALEQGMDEQAENYEMQFLTLNETIEALRNSNTFDREQFAEKIGEFQGEIRIKDLIINNHSTHCDVMLEHAVEILIGDLQKKDEE